MVIVGGSGNNFGAVLGGFLIWFAWIEAEPVGTWLIEVLTAGMAENMTFVRISSLCDLHALNHDGSVVATGASIFTPRIIPEESGFDKRARA